MPGDPSGCQRRIDPPLALPTELDRLAHVDGVLGLARRASPELLREKVHRRVRPERGRDPPSLRRLQGELPGPQRGILPPGQLESVAPRYPRPGLPGDRLAR